MSSAEPADLVTIHTNNRHRLEHIRSRLVDPLLLVVRLAQRLELIYGGPAKQPWQMAQKKGPNHRGVHSLAIGMLSKLHQELPKPIRLKPVI